MSSNTQLNAFLEKCELARPVAVVGPTATGKTDVGWQIADWMVDQGKASGCVLISVDSRQVYKDIPILSGADVPSIAQPSLDQHQRPFFQIDSHRLYGVSLCNHNQAWSVGSFKAFAEPIILDSLSAGVPVLLVGGTGLYHEHLFSNDPMLTIPPNETLRQELAGNSVAQLQNTLSKLDAARLDRMNNSDRENPRRLQRAIEVAHFFIEHGTPAVSEHSEPTMQSQYLGITADKEILIPRIRARVQQRFSGGALDEVARLVALDDTSEQLKSALGFRQLADFLAGTLSEQQCIDEWVRQEWAYAKRQITWWKSKPVVWLTK